MEPRNIHTDITVTIKDPKTIRSIFTISNIISTRMNKTHITIIFLYDKDKRGHKIFISCENTKAEIENRNQKSAYYIIPNNNNNFDIDYKCKTNNVTVSIDAAMFQMFLKGTKSCHHQSKTT